MNIENRNKKLVCHQCGNEFIIQPDGVSSHINTDSLDNTDYELDINHVPYEL